jgi:hypothetical protein
VRRPPLSAAIFALGAVAMACPALAQVSPEDHALLARTNLFSTVPERFHARLAVSRADWPRPLQVEMWRGGRDRLLVRLLDPTKAGRFLLQLGAEHYLIAPGAREPVRLGAGVSAAGGVSFEQVLGVDVERDFDVERVQTSGRIVTFHLVARPATAAARATPRVRWVVDQETRLPVRVDIVLADGRTARVVEFAGFLAGRVRVPSRLALKDVLRGGPPETVEVAAFEAVAVPDGLFSLTDGTSRAQLPPIAGPTPSADPGMKPR